MFKLIIRIGVNILALFIAQKYLSGFMLAEGWQPLLLGGLLLAFLNAFIKPVLKTVFKPLIWITFGLFNFLINMGLLWVADQMLTSLTINNWYTIFGASIIIAIANFF